MADMAHVVDAAVGPFTRCARHFLGSSVPTGVMVGDSCTHESEGGRRKGCGSVSVDQLESRILVVDRLTIQNVLGHGCRREGGRGAVDVRRAGRAKAWPSGVW